MFSACKAVPGGPGALSSLCLRFSLGTDLRSEKLKGYESAKALAEGLKHLWQISLEKYARTLGWTSFCE